VALSFEKKAGRANALPAFLFRAQPNSVNFAAQHETHARIAIRLSPSAFADGTGT
jgi:hypothetical protein